VPLGLALLGTTLAMLAAAGWSIASLQAAPGRRLRRLVLAGVTSGIVATLVYDLARFALLRIDPGPFDPFETLPIFGSLLVGSEAGAEAQLLAGIGFHLLNGTAFGLAYTLLFGSVLRRSARWALLSGIGWGLLLETFQLAIYPGWLQISAFDEFLRISAFGHLAYGSTLGLLAYRLLARLDSSGEEAR
jgi:hypothetical protein